MKDSVKNTTRNLERLEYVRHTAGVFISFIKMGFTSVGALRYMLMAHGYGDYSEQYLRNFWHFRQIDSELVGVLDELLEKLKNE